MDPSSISALADLLKSSATEEESRSKQAASAPALTPATLIPNSALPTQPGKADKAAAKKSAKDIWDDDEAVVADEVEDPHDTRKRPNFEILYKQKVGSEDVFLGLSDKSPSTLHCDTMVVRIDLPPVAGGRPTRLSDIELNVTDSRLSVATHAHRLATYLPLRVKSKEGNAAWDGAKFTLTLTLPIVREDF